MSAKARKCTTERFWAKVDKTETCWLWTASKDRNGYGNFNIGGAMDKAHRFSFEIAHNIKLPKNAKVRHTCNYPACVNPDHLTYSTDEERFWAKVKQSDGCWEWTAGKDKDGYGVFTFNGALRKAHRVSWELTRGPIPEGLQGLHKCDNPSCVRPSHLFLGTNLDNVADRTEKRRQPDGERHPDAKVTLEQVQKMRSEGKTGTYKSIAEKYGLSIAQTAKILLYQTWKNY